MGGPVTVSVHQLVMPAPHAMNAQSLSVGGDDSDRVIAFYPQGGGDFIDARFGSMLFQKCF